MPVKTLIRNVRLMSGLVLMTFVVSHLANLSIGLHSLAALESWRPLLLGPWRTTIGMILLGGAALVHMLLGLYAMSARRSLALSRTDVVQLVLGLLTPPLLLTHLIATHIAGEVGKDFDSSYGQMLAVYWSFAPRYAFQQLLVVMIVWIHGALGLYSWLVLQPFWRRVGGLVLPLLFAIPILALLGFAEAGREVLEKLATDPAWKAHIVDNLKGIVALVARLDAAKARVEVLYACLVLLAAGIMAARMLRDRLRPVQVAYDGGEVARGRRGLSILELSCANDIAHAHVCSGRGRCGTCRVRIDSGAQALSPQNDLEEATLPNIVLSATRFIVVAIGLGACAVALDTPLAELATRQGPLVRFAFSLLGVAALALFTNLIWIAIRTTIDRRLGRIPPLDPEGEPSPEARMLTLLPLLRVTAAVVLGVMLLLSSLWAIGIEITPLLAGAGVVGLALGFGAQALVRDVIAGIFFLAEDAFRVGEYIESGTATKGTVERITLRTVALRHHNGPLHFVPYGSLGTVRNNSRDWWIEKFNLPLPIDVDSETVRKLIKKVGEGMLQDPEIGPLMREPLKGKLYRIDPGVKIFRCKFETAPGKQFDVRAQAYKRIEAALKAMGIVFADGRQTVFIRQAADGVDAPGARPA